jgi:hypothetical protein
MPLVPTYCGFPLDFLLQEATEELYLIPAIDMLNHSSIPSLRNTSLALIRSEAEVTLGDGSKRRFKDFFSMKAGGCLLVKLWSSFGQSVVKVWSTIWMWLS